MAVKINKNKKLDVAYVQSRSGKIAKTIEIRPGILRDLDSKGNVVGIEVLSLTRLAPLLKTIPRKRRWSRKEAA